MAGQRGCDLLISISDGEALEGFLVVAGIRAKTISLTAGLEGAFEHSARAAQPWSPAHLRATWSGGDVVLSWIRRARKDGDGWGPGNPPVEGVEESRVRVSGGASIREWEVFSPNDIYLAAQQVTVFPAGGLALAEGAQIGSIVAPGPWTGVQVTIPES
jgi:hypothetical protein